MIKNFPLHGMHSTLKWSAGTLSVMLLVACSSPTKYPLRASLENNTKNTSSALENKLPASYSEALPETSLPVNVCGSVYRVKSGDSLSKIAQDCQVSMKQLAKLNQIFSPYTIYKNQSLTIPQNEGSPYKMAKTVSKSMPTVATMSHQTPFKKEAAPQAWLWPVHKSLPYRFIRDDAGLSIIEIYGVAGQEVKAVSGGSVVYSGDGITEFGKMVVIKHDDEHMSVYAHNSDLLVQEGDRVQAGQQIATLGATGNASQPKLYLEARFKGRKIDILKVLTVPKSN